MSAAADKLPKTMPAIVCRGPKDYRLEERDVPKPGPGEVLIRVKSTGICASDIKCYTGAALFWRRSLRLRVSRCTRVRNVMKSF